eukprot:TRINITY_DN4340_c0_g1_i1.p1 TRINITY_DN4340_c0_g1~~TRINITY_DN4340_c0_g1_i1.p1  ORF type:complete len:711 (+),score=179.26 TRINITY_DN4340_c0_g1_i1:78-2210(+)
MSGDAEGTPDLARAVKENNVDDVRKCVKEGGCPAGVRKDMWCMMMGVKEGVLREGDVDTSDMKMDVELMLQSTSGAVLEAADVEAILVDYCVCRGVPYSTELSDLVGPLISLEGVTPGVCSALLKAISHQFAPFLHYPTTAPIGEAEEATQVDTYNLLVRLMLQYHDAELCTHLDRNKCDTGVIITWLNGLFVNQLGLESIHELWDLFISATDPLIPTFFGLALLSANREQVLEASGEDAVSDMLTSMTIQGGLTACKELLAKAECFKKNTPPSACMSAIKLFNPIGSINQELHDELVTCVVLPVESEELIEAFKKRPHPTPQIKFMVLDCRAQKSYNFARLPTAVHIGPNVGYEPTRLSEMLERFEGARGSHFCLMGTGRGIQAESNLLNVLALRFVSNGFNHIGIAVDGFKGVIPFIKADLIEFVRETTDPQPPTPSKGLEDSTSERPQPQVAAISAVQAALKDVDTAALKEKADKVKKWGRGLLERWTHTAEPSSNAPAPVGAPSKVASPPQAAQPPPSRFGGYFSKGQKQEPAAPAPSPPVKSSEEPSFALLPHDSDGESDDFQLISHPTRNEKKSPEEVPIQHEEEAPMEAPVEEASVKEVEKEVQPEPAAEEKKVDEVQEVEDMPAKKEEVDDLFGEVEEKKEDSEAKEAKETSPAGSASPSSKKDVDIFADDFNIDDIELPSDPVKKTTAPAKLDDDLDDLFS